jgi:predicted nucleic acid-binding protein
MGLILDSSVLIAAERKGNTPRQALSEIARRVGGEDIALSVITVIELAHAAARSNSPERTALRRQFIAELTTAVPVHPVSIPIALRAGQIDGENTARACALPFRSPDRCYSPRAGLSRCYRKSAPLSVGSRTRYRSLLNSNSMYLKNLHRRHLFC